MANICFIMGDQLNLELPSLAKVDPEKDVVFMCEVLEEATQVKHHKKKLVLIFSAMRHFANELSKLGYQVVYRYLDDPENAGSFEQELENISEQYQPEHIFITEPSEYRVLEMLKKIERVILLPDSRFLADKAFFAKWASGRKQLRMEYFYREMRRSYNILMDGDQPLGGKWNYDQDNRKPPKDAMQIPAPVTFVPDSITQAVIALVHSKFAEHFGELEPFTYAVTREQALQVLADFIKVRLEQFGDYQDAMLSGEPWMYHSHISFYLNIGLLTPIECIKAVEQANAPINAVEGFIRQILGWREYVRGIYWLKMPEYVNQNYLSAHRALPEFYWHGDTKMNCLHQCVKETKANAYAHHIQRLMVLGNFALIYGVNPREINYWFWVVYADAFEWVELPNVSGMVLFADGGLLASKPYAAGGSYINKMSNYCGQCFYKVKVKTGENACPFNYLYWDFLARNRESLGNNQRLAMIYRVYDRMTDENKLAITESTKQFLQEHEKN